MACLIYFDVENNPVRYPLGKATLMVGNDQSNGIVLNDEAVNANHASIIFDKNKFWMRDNGSSSGSYVNGRSIQYAPLHNGDILCFGAYRFFFDEFDEQEKSKDTSVSDSGTNSTKESKYKNNHLRSVHLRLPNLTGGHLQIIFTNKIVHTRDVLSKVCLVFGILGFVFFLPAIILGHMAAPKAEVDQRYRIIGLLLGYGFLFAWVVYALNATFY